MAGNKINEQKAKTIFNIATLNLSVSKWIGLVVCVMLVLLLAWWQKDYLSHLLGCDKAFTKSDTRFKVLILPFKQLCDGKYDVGYVIKEHLMELDEKETLNIALYYANIGIGNNFTGDSAIYYMQYHHADFVVYGQYQDKNCGGKGKDEYCINYQTSPEWTKHMDEKNSSNTSNGIQMGNLGDILNGALITNIEYVVYYAAGVAQLNQANYLKSIAHYSKTISLKPDEVRGYYGRGFAYYSQQEYAKAIADFSKAIELGPKLAAAYNNRGSAYTYLKEYAQAIADYNKAIELDPKLAVAYCNRGSAYADQQEYAQAITDYNKAIELDPNDADVYYNRGRIYNELKEYAKAIADYNKAIELNPNDAIGYNNRGIVYKTLKEYAQAIADYSKAIELDPNDAAVYNNRGIVYADLKQYAQAIADYNKTIELNPKYARAYNNRGIAYANLKQYTQAIINFNKALSLLNSSDPFVETVKQNLQNAKQAYSFSLSNISLPL